ncbi:MAG: succinylglutamate desuccinylase/aspartoacylase family protein, partial [Bacteroidota bacterium]
MTEVYSIALDTSTKIERLIGKIEGETPGPTLIFMGGIHGNEPAGVFALKKVVDYLKPRNVVGNIYAIAGNLSALKKGIRYNQEDLNRLWTKQQVENLPNNSTETENLDIAEQIEVNNIINDILETEGGPFYFFDLHTTSSETLPFLAVNDSLLNRAFTVQYPLPIILGIEEYLDGPILSYINELGYVAFGFEAGQHDDMASIENCIAFILLTLTFTGSLSKDQIDYHKHFEILAKTTGGDTQLFEIYYRYLVENEEEFEMLPGF